MVANRLRKNYRRLKPWIERERISNYRLYDADIPEYAAAIDVYEGELHIAEYAPHGQFLMRRRVSVWMTLVLVLYTMLPAHGHRGRYAVSVKRAETSITNLPIPQSA